MGALASLKSGVAIAALSVALVAGIAIGATGAAFYAAWFTVPAAREAGATRERAAQQAEQIKANRAADAERRAAQEKIDAAGRRLLEQDAERAGEVAALEEALRQERTYEPPLVAGGACACHPAVPRSLSERLDRVGRSAPRLDPAGADVPVPGRR